jgi:putative oxidoreductase
MAEHREIAGSHDDGGKLVLRLALGLLVLFHGVSKVFGGPALAFVVGVSAKAGLPSAFGYLVYIGEVVAPLLLILGVWTRVGALILIINMIVAVLLVHTGQLFTLNSSGGYGLELQAMYLFSAVAVMLLGAGRYSVGGVGGRWN